MTDDSKQVRTETPGLRISYGPVPQRDAASLSELDVLFSDPYLTVAIDKPDWYPFSSIESDRQFLAIEGHIYGTAVSKSLADLSSLLARNERDGDLLAAIRVLTTELDGEFVVVTYDKTNHHLAVTSDSLGRLPLYSYHLGHTLLVSRSQTFILQRMSAPEVDRLGVSQLLALGYPLSDRTLVSQVSRLRPGTVVTATPGGTAIHLAQTSPYVADKPLATLSRKSRYTDILCDAFLESCRKRIVNSSNVLSLSGGIDSRTTGAGLRRTLKDFSAVTFYAPGSAHMDERSSAAAVAGRLGVPWHAYEYNYTGATSIDHLVCMKLGLNQIDVAFGLDYVRDVKQSFDGPVSFWTGEGADKLLSEHRALPHRPSADQLAAYVVQKNCLFPPSLAAAIVGIHVDDLLQSIHTSLLPHDANRAEDAYNLFLLTQRVVRFHAEGEDRHRAYVWPISPFFGKPFFSIARNIPGREKRGRLLYRSLLRSLAPDLSALALSGGHAAPDSLRFVLEYGARERLRNSRRVAAFYRNWKVRRRTQGIQDDPWRRQLGLIMAKHLLPSMFSGSECAKLSEPVARFSAGIPVLLTAILATRAITRSGTRWRGLRPPAG